MTSDAGFFEVTEGEGVITASFEACPLVQGEYLLKATIGSKGYPTGFDATGYDDPPFRFNVPDLSPPNPWAITQGETLHWPAQWQHEHGKKLSSS